MGTWEAEIFRNDVSEDVMTDYKNKLKIGRTDEDALKELLAESEEYLTDDEDKFDFWFGLALIMSDLGRLTMKLKTSPWNSSTAAGICFALRIVKEN